MSDSIQNIQQINVASIIADSAFNCRGNFTDSSVADLKSNIKEFGLLQPIVVSPRDDGKYDLVAGFRRFKAITQLGWVTVPANIRKLDAIQRSKVNLAENIKRKELNMLQEAWGIEHLVDLGLSPGTIADELNVSTQWVNVRLALLKIPYDAQQQAVAGLLTNADIFSISRRVFEEDKLTALKEINEAKANRQRIKLCQNTSEKVDVACQRKVGEVNAMIIMLQSVFGNDITTAALSWANGTITTRQFYRVVKERAVDLGVEFDPPCDLN